MRFSGEFQRYSRWTITFVAVMVLFFSAAATAQQLTGTLSGTAFDTMGAVVPSASVTLRNQASGDLRTATTDARGRFVITGVQPATYSINIAATGFRTWQENDIVMNQGDARDIPNIKLQIGGSSTNIEVIGGGDAVVPTDTPEISTALNQQMINDFPLQGRDAGELLKVMPGMALNNAGKNGSSFNDKIVGSNNGPVGAYSSNGTQPNGTMAYMLDGANLVDPGNFGTQIANINQDMVSQVKMLMSNYSAEYAKGPSIFQAFSKSGGRDFHGEAYLYTHNSVLDTVDAYTKSQGGTNAAESYYYMGGNVGGPVLLPWMKFNRDRNKLFFWGGYEYMKQQPAGSIVNYNVPNAAQLAGDFSNTGIPAQAISTWQRFYEPLTTNTPAGGSPTGFPVTDIDPNIKGILALYPKTNQAPSAGNGYTNYHYVNTSPTNRWEATGKLDYALSDNTKLTGSYTYQHEADLAPISIWWATPNTLPYPSPGASSTVTYVILTNLTHVFNPTTTNETVFTWSHFVNPYSLSDPSAVSRATNNYKVPGLFNTTTDQIPNINPDACCNEQMASINYYPMSTGTFGGVKQVPAVYDNFTKVLGNHTVKVGFYWDDSRNSQNSNGPNNGNINYATGTQNSTNNLAADVMLGRISQYQQQNSLVPTDTHFHQVSFYAQDSWRGSPRLTMNYGVRFDHIGQWYGINSGPGFQVWDQTNYDQDPSAPNAGLEWHAKDSSIPISGFKTPLFYWAPRVGFAWDIFGTGKTVFRGGFAVYRYQATSETASAFGGPFGSFEFSSTTPITGYANLATLKPPSSVSQNGSSVDAMLQGDDRAPFTNDWNATVSQALPYRSVLEVSYVGNRSANEYMDGTNSNLYDLNNNLPGRLYQPDPVYGRPLSPGAPSCPGNGATDWSLYCQNDPAAYTPYFNTQDYRPMQSYQNIYLLNHAPYSNYNSLQVSYTKQSGPVTFLANYTFSKVLGIRDGGSNNGNGNGLGTDPFVLRNNYGPLDYDHTHIINLTYNWKLPSLIHSNGLGSHLLAGTVNGWQLSGYTAFQSGAPLISITGTSINAQYPTGLTVPTVMHPELPDNSILLPNGLHAVNVSPQVWYGTDAIKAIIPALTCDPSKNLHQGQRFNPACFTTPAFGVLGPRNYPYMRANNYWDSDLGIYKSFHITESRYVQIRASATNWLNHPLRQFGLAGTSDNELSFIQTATSPGGETITSLSPTNTNTTTTGTPAFKNGSRFVTLAAKFYF
jgi:Carboxypeptidase regulatory-like domain/TonB-dependent Receptor Plug Domain